MASSLRERLFLSYPDWHPCAMNGALYVGGAQKTCLLNVITFPESTLCAKSVTSLSF